MLIRSWSRYVSPRVFSPVPGCRGYCEAKFTEGKVPPEVLKSLVFERLGVNDPTVLVGPSLGIDGAVIATPSAPVVVSTDPITGSTEDLGRLIVNVNANDIAVMGARPRYMVLTLLLPSGFDVSGLATIMTQVHEECVKLGVAVVGGHTEVTSAVTKPIASATMFGEQVRPISAAGARQGDKIILTKSVAMEGTLILLSECGDRLVTQGVFTKEEVKQGIEELKDTVSVVKDAIVSVSNEGVHAMHDPTEGGLINALYEMADASNLGFIIYQDKVNIRDDTKKLCNYFKIDPLHLISSGALLLTADPAQVAPIIQTLAENGIQASEIGEVSDHTTHNIIKNGKIESAKRPVQDSLWDALDINNKTSE